MKIAARFSVGMEVRVRSGVTDPDFPDMPLGGWGGTVRKVDRGSKRVLYLVEWNKATLDRVHPVFRKRCERDGFEYESMWLAEGDLEPHAGEPLSIEQPRKIVSRPLSENDQDDRIRMALGLTSDDPLPEVDEESLRAYHGCLSKRLAFPFLAIGSDGSPEDAGCPVQIIGLVPADECDESEGLICRALRGWETVELPLADIEVVEASPNRRLIEDYSAWFLG